MHPLFVSHRRLGVLAVAYAIFVAAPAFAQTPHDHSQMGHSQMDHSKMDHSSKPSKKRQVNKRKPSAARQHRQDQHAGHMPGEHATHGMKGFFGPYGNEP